MKQDSLKIKSISSFIIILIITFNCCADHITIAADDWCPVNCDPSSSKPGIMVEVAKKVFAKNGHTLEYKLLPWSRAIVEAREGTITGIIGAFIGDAPDFIFPQNPILMISANSFFVTKNSDWFYKELSSLNNIELGAIQNYHYAAELNKYIKKNKQVQLMTGINTMERNIKKLLAGRIDAMVASDPVFWYTAAKMGVSDFVKSAGYITKPQPCFIAFSPAIEKSPYYARILSEGIEALKLSGEFDKILAKYGLRN